LCFFHANPNKASELGRIGGRSKHNSAAEDGDPLPTVDNAVAVRNVVARLIAEIHAGKVHPRVAAGLAPLLNLQLRAIETADLELRIVKVEKTLAEMERLRKRSVEDPTDPKPEFAGDEIAPSYERREPIKADGLVDTRTPRIS